MSVYTGVAYDTHTYTRTQVRVCMCMCVHVQKNAFMCVKKNLCPELGLNCCTSAWRSELLPTGLLGSVNRCLLGVACIIQVSP